MALRDDLRAEQHRPVGGRETAQRRCERSGFRNRIRVEAKPLELRHPLFELPLEALGAGADPREPGRTAGGTGFRRRLSHAAVVAMQESVAVEDERDIAVRAATGLAAGAAVQRRRDAAPVEQQDRLPAALGELSELAQQRRRERIAGLAAQVDDSDGGTGRPDTLADVEPLE